MKKPPKLIIIVFALIFLIGAYFILMYQRNNDFLIKITINWVDAKTSTCVDPRKKILARHMCSYTTIIGKDGSYVGGEFEKKFFNKDGLQNLKGLIEEEGSQIVKNDTSQVLCPALGGERVNFMFSFNTTKGIKSISQCEIPDSPLYNMIGEPIDAAIWYRGEKSLFLEPSLSIGTQKA